MASSTFETISKKFGVADSPSNLIDFVFWCAQYMTFGTSLIFLMALLASFVEKTISPDRLTFGMLFLVFIGVAYVLYVIRLKVFLSK